MRPIAPRTTITTPMPTIPPGPRRDQSTCHPIVSLAMTSPAKTMATRPRTTAEALGPFGRTGPLTAGSPTPGSLTVGSSTAGPLTSSTLSWIGLPTGVDRVTGVFSSMVLLLHDCELSDADSGIDHDLGWPVAHDDRPGYIRAALPVVPRVPGQEHLAQAYMPDDLDVQAGRHKHLQVAEPHGRRDGGRDRGCAEALHGQLAQVEDPVPHAQVVVGTCRYGRWCPGGVSDPSTDLDPGGHNGVRPRAECQNYRQEGHKAGPPAGKAEHNQQQPSRRQ